MADLYHGEYPVDMTPAEARAELASRERETLHSPEEQRRLSDAVEAQARRTAVADTVTPALHEGGRFLSWSSIDLAAQCLSQAREQLDPEFSQFMTAVAARLASTQPAPAFPREEVERGIERVCETISLEFKGFWTAEDLVEELPALIRREFAALLQGKQP